MSSALMNTIMPPSLVSGTDSLQMTGNPSSVPPSGVMSGCSFWPSALRISEMPVAWRFDMTNTPLVGARLAVQNLPSSVAMSVRSAAASVPVAGTSVTRFVTEAGLTFETSNTCGLMNCSSLNFAMPLSMSLRTTASTFGFVKRAASSETTRMPDAFAQRIVISPMTSSPTAAGAPSPTHP